MICLSSFFTYRVFNMGNSPPNSVVHDESTDTLKKQSNQEIIYSYRAKIQEIGSRSLIN